MPIDKHIRTTSNVQQFGIENARKNVGALSPIPPDNIKNNQCAPTGNPNIEFYPIQGQPENQLIVLKTPANLIAVVIPQGFNDQIGWIHWIQQTVSKDMDSLDALFFAGLPVGSANTKEQPSPFGVTPLSNRWYGQTQICVFKFCVPITQFFFTGWAEDETSTPVDGNWNIIATSDMEDIFSVFPSGA